ncbi:MAG: hypothetical protein ACE5M4_04640, partial [Anaerolineales bacterium]
PEEHPQKQKLPNLDKTRRGMETVSLVLAWLLAGFLAALMVIIIVLVLSGRIKLDKLISESNGDASLSRFQFVIFTFVIAASFFLIVVGVDRRAFRTASPARSSCCWASAPGRTPSPRASSPTMRSACTRSTGKPLPLAVVQLIGRTASFTF